MSDTLDTSGRIQALRELVERYEHLAQHASIPEMRDRYLELADLYYQRAEAAERSLQRDETEEEFRETQRAQSDQGHDLRSEKGSDHNAH